MRKVTFNIPKLDMSEEHQEKIYQGIMDAIAGKPSKKDLLLEKKDSALREIMSIANDMGEQSVWNDSHEIIALCMEALKDGDE